MSTLDLDAALLEMTDAQINAALVRRAQAKAARVRQQSADRMAAMRARKAGADQVVKSDASVTKSVTQKKGHFSSKSYAKRDADVTQEKGANQPVKEENGFPSGLPSGKEETPGKKEKNPQRGEKEKKTAPVPETVAIPDQLAALPQFPPTWAKFIESRRLIGQPMTYLAAERLLTRLAQRPDNAVAGVDLAIEKQWQGFNWTWFDNEQLPPVSRNGHRVGFQSNGSSLSAASPIPINERSYTDTTI